MITTMHVQQRWTLLLLLAVYNDFSSGAPLTCDPVILDTCVNTFIQDLDKVYHSADELNDTAELASLVCSNIYPTYQQCVSGCNYSTPNLWVSAVDFMCTKTESEQILGLECFAKPGFTDALLVCNSAIPDSTEDPCGLVTNHTKCVKGVTSQLCSVGGSNVVQQFILHLLQPVIENNNCIFPTPLSPEHWFTTLLPTPPSTQRPVASVTCDPLTLETCANNLTQDLNDVYISANEINDTAELVSLVCGNINPTYQQCVSGCNYSTPNIWVSAVEFLCTKTESEQILGLNCFAKPGMEEAILVCNSEIPQSAGDPCGLATNYAQCVREAASRLCSVGGSLVVQQYILHLLQPMIDNYNCIFPTPLPAEHWSTTLLPTPPSTQRPVPTPVCGVECLHHLGHASLTYNEALVRENFSMALLLDSCQNLTLYNQCMTKYPDCDADNTMEHVVIRNPIAFACGQGKQGIESNKKCWEKPEVKQAWTWCTFGKVAQDGNMCTTTFGRMSCLNSEINNLCPDAASLVNNFTVAISSDLLRILNCHVTTAVPEVTAETTSAPEPEPELTASPATPEPGPEVTYSATSPLPEPEGTAPTTHRTPVPPTQCDMLSFNQCLSDLSQKIQLWVQNLTSRSALTNSLDISALDFICRTYREEYKPCSEHAISGCSRDLTLIHETFTAALDYVCTLDGPTLVDLLPCLGDRTIVQGILQCNRNIPQATTSVCGVTAGYSNCVNDLVSGVCNNAAQQVFNDFLTQSLQPFNEYYGCRPMTTTEATTSTAASTTSSSNHISTSTFKTITDSFTNLPGMCTEDCRRELTEAFSSTDINLLTYTQVCPLYENFKRCYDGKPASCKTPGPDDVINSVFNYTCGEGQEKIQRTKECWIKPEITGALISCSREINSGMADQMCRAYSNYYSCLKTSMLSLCNQEAYEVLTEFVSVTTKVERNRLGCPDPVITRPPLNIACYDCHSGGTSWRNPHCTVDGNITDSWVAKTTCKDSCFAKTDKWNEGVVYRGCAENFLPFEYPRPLPRFGCRNISGETWCFCDGDNCNNMSMSQYLLA